MIGSTITGCYRKKVIMRTCGIDELNGGTLHSGDRMPYSRIKAVLGNETVLERPNQCSTELIPNLALS